jgi:hypothetical protein
MVHKSVVGVFFVLEFFYGPVPKEFQKEYSVLLLRIFSEILFLQFR